MKKALHSATDDGAPESLDFRAASTPALMGLLMTWGYNPRHLGGMGNSLDRENLQTVLLEVLLLAAGPEVHTCSMFVCERPSLDDFGFASGPGSSRQVVSLQDGSIDIGGLLTNTGKICERLRSIAGGRALWEIGKFLSRPGSFPSTLFPMFARSIISMPQACFFEPSGRVFRAMSNIVCSPPGDA